MVNRFGRCAWLDMYLPSPSKGHPWPCLCERQALPIVYDTCIAGVLSSLLLLLLSCSTCTCRAVPRHPPTVHPVGTKSIHPALLLAPVAAASGR